jgi:hypothetical protein
MMAATTDSIQEALDAAIAHGDVAEMNRLGKELLAAREAHEAAAKVEQLVSDSTAAVIKKQSAAKREAGRRRADAAVRDAMASAPTVTFIYGPIQAVVTFNTADPMLIAAAATAVRDAALVVQQSWVGRVAAIRGAAMQDKKPLSLDAHGIAAAIKNAMDFAVRKNLVKIEVKKRKR